MPGPLSDCYVLAPVRSREAVAALLDFFAPVRSPVWDTNEPPTQLAGFEGVATEARLVDFLVRSSSLACTLYFRCIDPSVDPIAEHAVVSFNEDGSLILGLSGPETAGPAMLGLLEGLSEESGYWTVEEAPPLSRVDFRARRASRRERC